MYIHMNKESELLRKKLTKSHNILSLSYIHVCTCVEVVYKPMLHQTTDHASDIIDNNGSLSSSVVHWC